MSPSKDSTPERKDAKQRVEEIRREQVASERRRALLLWSSVGLVVVLIAGGVTYEIIRQRANAPDLGAVKDFTVTQGHVSNPVDYKQTPPVGGEHNPIWLNCGVYDKPVLSENAVHSMEHGAVWVKEGCHDYS